MQAQMPVRPVVSVAVLLVAFASALAAPEEKDEHGLIRDDHGTIMRGVVVKIEPADPMNGFVARLLLDADPAKSDSRNQVRVIVRPKAVIKVVVGKETKQARVADLKKGQRVQLVKVEGVLFSLPPVADVTEILILDEGK
jgi:hypothetical protein